MHSYQQESHTAQLAELTALPQTPSWWGGGLTAPIPKNPTPRLGPSGLARPCLLTFDYLPPPLIYVV